MAGAFTTLQAIVDSTLSGISSPEIAQTVDAIGKCFGTIMLLWITFKSIDIALGRREFSFADNIHKILMVSIILTIAMDTGGWMSFILSAVDEFKGLIVSNGGAIAQLDAITDDFNRATAPIISNAPWGAGWLISLIFWASFFVMVGSALFLLLGAEITLAMTLLFSPLAIMSLTFEYTRKVFDGWLSAVIGAIVTMVLSGIIMSIMASITRTTVTYLQDSASMASFVAAGSCFFFSLFFYYFMSDVKSLAKALTGFACGCVYKILK